MLKSNDSCFVVSLEVAEHLEIKNFKASKRWLERFRKRHMISFKCGSGKSAYVKTEIVKKYLSELLSLLEDYVPGDNLNVDETGLFYCALSNKTMYLKQEKCHGGKISMERFTVLLCSSMAKVKESPLIIRKSAKSLCFKGMNLSRL